MEHAEYEAYLAERKGEYELRCNRCGRCCGTENDPCLNLLKLPDERYHCRDYTNHLRMQETVGGNTFNCVSVRDLIKKGAAPEGCAYTKAPQYGHVN